MVVQKLQFNNNAEHSVVQSNMLTVLESIKKDVETKGTHLSEFKTVQFGCWGDFLKNIDRVEDATILEKYIASLNRVSPVSAIIAGNDVIGYTFNEKNGYMDVYFDGTVVKRDKKHTIKSGKTGTKVDGHLRTTLFHYKKQTDVSIERIIYIAHAIYNNNIPTRFRGLTVNVMDLTGNVNTASKLGLKPNFNPDNLEWAFNKENSSHYDTCVKLYNWFGQVYRVSANDNYLYELVRHGSKEQVAEYLSWFN